MNTPGRFISIGILTGLVSAAVCMAVSIETVSVGNPGNPGDPAHGGFGAVGYPYHMGTYEVTAAQYTEFLNAVAAVEDTYGLYNVNMWQAGNGCKIERGGVPGNLTYIVGSAWADRPVNYVSWGDAARFANWLHNGQPTGVQGPSTTENGSYDLNGATTDAALMEVRRLANATWVVPSHDEWYKAAYHKNDPGAPGGDYWSYPTGTDETPSNDLVDPDPGNHATFYDNGYTIGSPCYRTEVGAHENSPSPYGTFDQGGNVFEWTERVLGVARITRGGAYNTDSECLTPSLTVSMVPSYEHANFGFRVAVRKRPGDCDRDGNVDLDDYVFWATCLSGPDAASRIECEDADFDEDGDVDLADFAGFQRVFGDFVIPTIMVRVPADEFQMGDTFAEGESTEQPVHGVHIDAFAMDMVEVTNQQYAKALNWALKEGNLIAVAKNGVVYQYGSGAGYPYCDTTTSSSESHITWDGSTFGVVSGKETCPMVLVSWYGAVAYANWRSAMEGKLLCYDLSTWECDWGEGYRLPTEAEWEKAARGGTSGHRFPWSDTDTIQHARANYFSSSGYSYDTSPTRGFHPMFMTGVPPYTSFVTYFAPNGCGLYDMAGNVWEWCNDWYSPTYYSDSPYDDPLGPASGTWRVVRGGSWIDVAFAQRCARRGYAQPADRTYYAGFRLVLDPG